jgi:hypothetical protein
MASFEPPTVRVFDTDAPFTCPVFEKEFEDEDKLTRSTVMTVLPSPEIISCETVSLCGDEQFLPNMGALNLNWNGWPGARRPHVWSMPLGLTVTGPVPTRFGVRISRVAEDRYNLHLVWDRTGFAWVDLTHDEMKRTSLGELLESIGTNLDSLLSQPIRNDITAGCRTEELRT